MKRALVLAAILALVAGCAAMSGGITSSDPFRSQAERRLSVRVENIHGSEVTISALGPGRRHSLGKVQGRSVRQFSIPWSSYQEVRFQIEPAAGRRHTTTGVPVGPGEFVSLIVVEPVERSTIRR